MCLWAVESACVRDRLRVKFLRRCTVSFPEWTRYYEYGVTLKCDFVWVCCTYNNVRLLLFVFHASVTIQQLWLNLAIRYFSYPLLEERPKYAASWRFNAPFAFNVTSTTVSPFATAQTFCASRDGLRYPEISQDRYLLIQRYFCMVCNCGEKEILGILKSKTKIRSNHAFFRDSYVSLWKKKHTLLCISKLIVAKLSVLGGTVFN